PMLNRVYEALNFTGIKIGFVTERQAAEGALKDYKVIIAPQATHVTDAAFGGLSNYVDLGGKIITVGGNCFAWNEYNQLRRDGLPIFAAFPSSLTAQELWQAFDEQLSFNVSATEKGWNAPRPVRVVDSEGRPVWGVELLCAEYAGGLVINLVNYTRVRQVVRLEMKRPYRAVNLFTGEVIPDALTLEPLEPLFIQSF
ncbi:MAG: beta-galactosidase trimerization domain-containing protein, partial [Candidatus Poribacteria bacterium]